MQEEELFGGKLVKNFKEINESNCKYNSAA